MFNCICGAHCTKTCCDTSCSVLAEMGYLLNRNGITFPTSPVFNQPASKIEECEKILDDGEFQFIPVITQDTTSKADLFTYCAICNNWRGSRLHMVVYHLKFAQYIDALQNSWSDKSGSDDVEYMKIWASQAQVLIISNIDYVIFRDFACQTLLNLIQERTAKELTTVLVSPPASQLVGESLFFGRLTQLLNKGGTDK